MCLVRLVWVQGRADGGLAIDTVVQCRWPQLRAPWALKRPEALANSALHPASKAAPTSSHILQASQAAGENRDKDLFVDWQLSGALEGVFACRLQGNLEGVTENRHQLVLWTWDGEMMSPPG